MALDDVVAPAYGPDDKGKCVNIKEVPMKMRPHKKILRSIRGWLRRKVLSRYGIGVLANTWNGLLVVEASDFSVGRKLLGHGEYDRRQITFLKEVIWGDSPADGGETKGDIVVVGAHIGAVLIPMAKCANAATCFEIDESNLRLLRANLLLNSVGNVTIVSKAIGARKGSAGVVRNNINTGNTTIDVRAGQRDAVVDVTTLDSEFGDKRIKLMIMDIEGHEMHAIDGGVNVLANTEYLYIEFAPEQLLAHGSDPGALLQRLVERFPYAGYLDGRTVVAGSSGYVADEVRLRQNARGYLVNLLFSQRQLPDVQIQ